MSQKIEKMSRADMRRIERKGPLATARMHLYRLSRENRILKVSNILTIFLVILVAAALLIEVLR